MKSVQSVKCRDCGFSFPKSQAWATRCIVCFKKGKGYNRVIADDCFLWSQHELRRLEMKLKEAQQELAAVQAHGGRAPQKNDITKQQNKTKDRQLAQEKEIQL